MPLGINVFSFGLFGAYSREKAGPGDDAPGRDLVLRPAPEIQRHGISDDEKPPENRTIFRSGFFPIY